MFSQALSSDGAGVNHVEQGGSLIQIERCSGPECFVGHHNFEPGEFVYVFSKGTSPSPLLGFRKVLPQTESIITLTTPGGQVIDSLGMPLKDVFISRAYVFEATGEASVNTIRGTISGKGYYSDRYMDIPALRRGIRVSVYRDDQLVQDITPIPIRHAGDWGLVGDVTIFKTGQESETELYFSIDVGKVTIAGDVRLVAIVPDRFIGVRQIMSVQGV